MEALKEHFNKVMNYLETCKRFVDHVGNSICQIIYMVDRYRGELMSREMDRSDRVCREIFVTLTWHNQMSMG